MSFLFSLEFQAGQFMTRISHSSALTTTSAGDGGTVAAVLAQAVADLGYASKKAL